MQHQPTAEQMHPYVRPGAPPGHDCTSYKLLKSTESSFESEAFVGSVKTRLLFVGSGSSTRKRIMKTNIKEPSSKLLLQFLRIFPRRGHLGRAADQLCIVVQAILGMVDHGLSLLCGTGKWGSGGGEGGADLEPPWVQRKMLPSPACSTRDTLSPHRPHFRSSCHTNQYRSIKRESAHCAANYRNGSPCQQ